METFLIIVYYNRFAYSTHNIPKQQLHAVSMKQLAMKCWKMIWQSDLCGRWSFLITAKKTKNYQQRFYHSFINSVAVSCFTLFGVMVVIVIIVVIKVSTVAMAIFIIVLSFTGWEPTTTTTTTCQRSTTMHHT